MVGLAIVAIVAAPFAWHACAKERLAPCPPPTGPELALHERGFLGLDVRADAQGRAIVHRVLPGPLEGDGFTSASVTRGDVVRAIDGCAVDAAAFDAHMARARPGETVRVALEHEGEPRPIEALLVASAPWVGLLERTRELSPRPGRSEEARTLVANHMDATSVPTFLAAHPPSGPHRLARLDRVFASPLDVEREARELAESFSCAERDVDCVLDIAARELGVQARVAPTTAEPVTVADLIVLLDERSELAETQLARAFTHVADRAARGRDALDLLDALPAPSVVGHSDPRRLLDLIALSATLDYSALVEGFRAIASIAALDLAHVVGAPHRAGHVVVAGMGDDRHVLDGDAIVVDLGGDDVYVYEGDASIRLVIDLGGDDRYESTRGGAGGAIFGVDAIFDRDGDDRYACGTVGCGAAAFGIAVVVDERGDDTYEGRRYVQGAALYGVAALVDRAGADTYVAHHGAQGFAGPYSLALLLDARGDDSYLASRVTPSVYGQGGAYLGLSQGVGVGVRGYESGGLGVLVDREGADRYVAGELSQGGGYFSALGVLLDVEGRDAYQGQRYAQGFGCHEGAGALLDDGGDDHYRSGGPASMGAGWDRAVGILVDHGGNDAYEGGTLALGAGAQQAIGLFRDDLGDDTYAARDPSLGARGDDDYHAIETHDLASLGVFLDGAGMDTYPAQRGNGRASRAGSLFVDR